MNEKTENDITEQLLPEMTPRQRMVGHLCRAIGDDMDRGTLAEAHTAVALRVLAEALRGGYIAELATAMQRWALAREAGHG